MVMARTKKIGSPVINETEPHHEGHKVYKGGKSLGSLAFSFVTVVSFRHGERKTNRQCKPLCLKKRFPSKTLEPKI